MATFFLETSTKIQEILKTLIALHCKIAENGFFCILGFQTFQGEGPRIPLPENGKLASHQLIQPLLPSPSTILGDKRNNENGFFCVLGFQTFHGEGPRIPLPENGKLASHQLIQPLLPSPSTILGDKRNNDAKYFLFVFDLPVIAISKYVICDPRFYLFVTCDPNPFTCITVF